MLHHSLRSLLPRAPVSRVSSLFPSLTPSLASPLSSRTFASAADDAEDASTAAEDGLIPRFPKGSSGDLYTWGSASGGQLGHGEGEASESLPRLMTSLGDVKWKQVSCGNTVSAGVTTTGDLYTWGKCPYFSLGHGEEVTELAIPAQVQSLNGIPMKQISVGEYHCAAVSEEGEVYTFGWGGGFMFGSGGLGHGDHLSQPYPALVEALEGVAIDHVSCGQRHTLALTEDGQVMSWGNGEFGRCGNGRRSQKVPEVIDALEGIKCVQVEAGQVFSLAVSEEGQVFVWGKNDQSQLGLGANMAMDMNTMEEYPIPLEGLSDVASVAAGKTHSLAFTHDGRVFYWGARNFIEPHHMEILSDLNVTPTQISAGDNISALLDSSGTVYTWGKGLTSGAALGIGRDRGVKQPHPLLCFEHVPIASISAGSSHCAAIAL